MNKKTEKTAVKKNAARDTVDLKLAEELDESELALRRATKDADDGSFTLEDILAEFSEYDTDALQEAAKPDKPPVKPRRRTEKPGTDAALPAAPAQELPNHAAQKPAESASTPPPDLHTVLTQTVQSVLEEEAAPAKESDRRHTLRFFARTDARPAPPPVEELLTEEEQEPVGAKEPEPIEPPLDQLVEDARRQSRGLRRRLIPAVLLTLLLWVPLALSYFSLMPSFYETQPLFGSVPFLVGELLVCILGYDVFVYAVRKLLHGRFSYELSASIACLITLADTLLSIFHPARGTVLSPFHAVACVGMVCALAGRYARFNAHYQNLRVAAANENPYIVTITAGGAAKRIGQTVGFSSCTMRDDLSERWQAVLFPILLVSTAAFAALSTAEAGVPVLFLWNWSVILLSANALAFPLVCTLPLRRVTKRIVKNDSAVAGYVGADQIRRSNCAVITDHDLFPPGTLDLTGIRFFTDDHRKAISYAASIVCASESGLSRLFALLRESEGVAAVPLSDLNFYEDGGVAASLRGETVFFGTENFCRTQGVLIPKEASSCGGMFLAADGALLAVFFIQYTASENIAWALRLLHRARITPVLASRDVTITPALLRKEFGTDANAVYPALSMRLALSERSGGGSPYALLLREGLLPYAEVAVGSKRACRSAVIGTVLTVLGSISGTLLAFYLTFSGAYTVLTPLSMLAFLLLWLVAALSDGLFVAKY